MFKGFKKGALILLSCAVAFCEISHARAENSLKSVVGVESLSVNRIFGDNMVVQRNQPIKIWGKGQPGSNVEVAFNGTSVTAELSSTGSWSLALPEQKAGGPYVMNVISGSKTIAFKNVMVGDVWLASGQSNMEWPLYKTDDGAKDLEQGYENSMIRIFKVPHRAVVEPQEDTQVDIPWSEAGSKVAKDFSAVAWFFAKKIQKELQVPVGIVMSAKGGTRANVWASSDSLKKLSSYSDHMKSYKSRVKKYARDIKQWEAGTLKRKPKHKPLHYYPGGYYNGQIHPLQPLSIQGVIWYQGETDRNAPERYAETFQTLIKDWRQGFENPNMPFIYVQLPRFLYKKSTPNVLTGNYYPFIREAQLQSLALPNTAMAITIDTGTIDDIHPRIKKPIGERLATAALGKVYGKKECYMGPTVKSIKQSGSEFVVSFDNIGDGLVVKGEALNGFKVAGQDGEFYDARASLLGNDVVVTSDAVVDPAYIRYAWEGYPKEINLFNKDGLPASPFRNDTMSDVVVGTDEMQ